MFEIQFTCWGTMAAIAAFTLILIVKSQFDERRKRRRRAARLSFPFAPPKEWGKRRR